VGRVLLGEVEDESFGIGVQQVQATHGVVVLGVGGPVAGGGAGLAGAARLNVEVLAEGLLGGAVLAAVK
jgi:hypothetical protein